MVPRDKATLSTTAAALMSGAEAKDSAQASAPAESLKAHKLDEISRDPSKLQLVSPFSEQMGPYRLSKEDFQWHEVEPGLHMRGLWAGELYQERRSAGTGRYVRASHKVPTT